MELLWQYLKYDLMWVFNKNTHCSCANGLGHFEKSTQHLICSVTHFCQVTFKAELIINIKF